MTPERRKRTLTAEDIEAIVEAIASSQRVQDALIDRFLKRFDEQMGRSIRKRILSTLAVAVVVVSLALSNIQMPEWLRKLLS